MLMVAVTMGVPLPTHADETIVVPRAKYGAMVERLGELEHIATFDRRRDD